VESLEVCGEGKGLKVVEKEMEQVRGFVWGDSQEVGEFPAK
jgi:hypothetical protein